MEKILALKSELFKIKIEQSDKIMKIYQEEKQFAPLFQLFEK